LLHLALAYFDKKRENKKVLLLTWRS